MPIAPQEQPRSHARSTSAPSGPAASAGRGRRPVRKRIATDQAGPKPAPAAAPTPAPVPAPAPVPIPTDLPLGKAPQKTKSKAQLEDEALIRASKEHRRATFKVEGRRKAVLIGINYVGQGKVELKGCWNDVNNIKAFITSSPFNFSTDPDCMKVLTDDPATPPHLRPTRANILTALRWLTQDITSSDSLFLHFSGHGVQREDHDGDEEDGFDESILPVDYTKEGPILDDDLNRILVQTIPPTARLTCIFDSCHSGTVLDLPFCYTSTGNLALYDADKEARENQDEAIECAMRGDTKNCVGNLIAGLHAVAGEGERAYRLSRKTKTSRGDVILFSGAKDDQVAADAKIDGAASGALSFALIKTAREYGVVAFGGKPGGNKVSYAVLLASMRAILREKFSQKVQLSSGRAMNMGETFSL